MKDILLKINLPQDIMIAVLIFLGVYLGLAFIRQHILNRLEQLAKKTKAKFDDVVIEVLQGIGTPFFAGISLYAAVQHLSLPYNAGFFIRGFFLVVLVHEVIKIVQRITIFFLRRHLKNGAQERGATHAIAVMIKVVLWVIGILLILSNLGFNVNSLIASLGIGGLAVSLALQNVFNDIFSSFSIVIDKPFEEGDFIKLSEGESGIVESIGLKTTRIKTLQGEELVVSNAELTSTRVRNFKKLEHRRIVFAVGVTYDTTVTKLKKIPTVVRKIFKEEKMADLDRVHLKELGDFSLNFEVVYFVKSSEYVDYMDTQQKVNLAILKEFAVEGIDIAFPTQTVMLERGE